MKKIREKRQKRKALRKRRREAVQNQGKKVEERRGLLEERRKLKHKRKRAIQKREEHADKHDDHDPDSDNAGRDLPDDPREAELKKKADNLHKEIEAIDAEVDEIDERLEEIDSNVSKITNKIKSVGKSIRKAVKKAAKKTGPEAAVKAGIKDIGKTEQPYGSNWGGIVQKMILWLGYSGPVYWCGCAAGWWMLNKAEGQATAKIRRGYAGFVEADARSKTNGLEVVNAPVKGGWATLWNNEHIVMTTGNTNGSMFETIEGNTSSSDGSQSNGGGVYRKWRSIQDADVFAKQIY